MAKPSKAAFEKSGYDDDRGMKEGSKADKALDKKQMKRFVASKKKGARKK